MGVVVRRYIDILIIIINFPYSTCISSFLAAASLYTSLFIFKCLIVLVYVIFVQYIAYVTQKTFEIVQKNRDHANISIIKNVERASTACARESRDFHV